MKRERLRIEREKLKKTQNEVANDLNVSMVYIRKIEAGVVSPGRDLMIKIGTYYNVDLPKLFPDIFFEQNDKKFIKNSTNQKQKVTSPVNLTYHSAMKFNEEKNPLSKVE